MKNKLCALSIMLCCLQAYAQSNISRRPSADEIVQRLSGQPNSYGPRLGQGVIRNKGVAIEGATPNPVSEASVDLEVNFEFNSPVLTPDAKIVLDSLGRALNATALKDSRIQIQGHTDAVGSDEANLVLSQNRAKSAARYLVQFHAINPSRLDVMGYGKTRLANPSNPFAAENRRVKVVNLGP